MKVRPMPPPNVSEIRRVPEGVETPFESIKHQPELTREEFNRVQQRAREELESGHLCPHAVKLKFKWVWGIPAMNGTKELFHDHVIASTGACPQCMCQLWLAYSLRRDPGSDFWGFLQGYAIGSAMKLGFQFFKR